jgi:Ni/Fe-hydrogenase 1 B-type cytochrome subunit
VAAPAVDPGTLVPYAPDLYDKDAYAAMRAMRAPFVLIHEYGFYALILMAATHIAAVVLTEIRGGGNLVSAMFTGNKILRVPEARSRAIQYLPRPSTGYARGGVAA